MRIVVLAGGTGSAKLLRGLQGEVEEFTVISNVGDNFWHKGLFICPDIDIALYTLAGIADTVKGWGIERDTFNVLAQLSRLGEETWFSLGDRDLATHIFRTVQLSRGRRLGAITSDLARRLGVKQDVVPCTDDSLETHVVTIEEDVEETLHLQEFWVRKRGQPEVKNVVYAGAEKAVANPKALAALEAAERIILCPANPVTSILPILSVRGFRDAIANSKARRVAVSPMIGFGPVSGPAGKMMKGMGYGSDSLSVARLYKGLVDCMLIDSSDAIQKEAIEREGTEVSLGSTLMSNREKERELASRVLSA